MPHHLHYRVVCPDCKTTVWTCDPDCPFSWHTTWHAPLPCKACTAKLAVIHDKFKFAKRGNHR